MPVALEYWGDFPPQVAACQRTIGSAGAACGLQTWRLERACAMANVSGVGCDTALLASQEQSIRLAAEDRVTASCTTQQVSLLQFLGTFEAGVDVNTFCRELKSAATSVLVDPLPPRPLAADELECVDRTLRMAGKLFSMSFESRQRLLNRIALGSYSPPRKRQMVATSSAAIAATAADLQHELDAVCPATMFAGLFHQSAADVMTKLSTRADCLAGQTYAQGGLLCPLSTCGNLMVEHNEECDDGNTVSGDGCSADCYSE